MGQEEALFSFQAALFHLKVDPPQTLCFQAKGCLVDLTSSNLVFPAAGDPRGDRTAREKLALLEIGLRTIPSGLLNTDLTLPRLDPMDYVVKSSKQGIWPIHSSSLPMNESLC